MNFVAVLVVVIAVIIDGTITGFAASTGGLKSSIADITVFAAMISVFAGSQFIIMSYVKQEYKDKTLRSKDVEGNFRLIGRITSLIQYAILIILLFTILQLVLFSSYHLSSVLVCILMSYGLSFVLLVLLTKHFLLWSMASHNSVVFAYTLAIGFIALNAISAIFYVWVELSNTPSVVGSMTRPLGAYSSTAGGYSTFFALVSFLAFVLTWIATVLLLKHYSERLGRMKYWTVVTIPLVYFLTQFQTLFLTAFAEFRLSDPVLFGIVYNLIFSVSKPLGGILFGIAFWTVARYLKEEKVKGYLILSAYGMVLLFSANQPTNLILAPYPPFGMVTICFMGLASYLLYSGIYSSAVSVSQDSSLRQSIRNLAFKESQKLLDLIGTAQMEQEVLNKVMKVSKQKIEMMESETGVGTSLNSDDVKRYLDEVLQELKKQQIK